MATPFAITGLGNPGPKYENNRHNLGFKIIERLADSLRLSFSEKYKGLYAKGKLGGNDVHLLMPQTYMNLSGESLGPLVRFFKIDLADVLIVHDEMDMDLGQMKFARNGGAGGHNGIKSVYSHVGKEVWRLKVGVSRPPAGDDPADYLLRDFRKEEWPSVEEIIESSVSAIESFVQNGVEKTMNTYNQKPKRRQ